MATRRGRWYPPPPPTPRILHLPRRIRRIPTKNLSSKLGFLNKQSSTRGHNNNNDHRGKLETLFDQERAFSKTVPIVLLSSSEDLERRERVEEGFDFHDEEEEKWKFQAEILRAECNFLRMEREIALKKLEMNQVQTKKTLRFAVETLNSDKKKKIYKEEIEDLEEKLDELQRKSGVTDIEIKKCTNFDKKASVLQKKLESLKFKEKSFVQEIQQEALASLNIKTSRFNNPKIIKQDQTSRFIDVEILGKKMEGISKGMLERMEEEYRSMLSSCSSSVTTSGTSSASTSSRFEFFNSSSSSSSSSIKHQQNQNQERMLHEQQQVCTGRCKAIVRKIVEQVRSEMEQWSQMQDMLKRVKEEMEELQASRDFWEDRALNSDIQAKSLQSAMQEWKDKALSSDKRVSELEKEMSDLHMELTKSKTESNMDASRTRSLGMVQWDRPSQKEKEKRVLICENLKEKKRLPDAKQNKICYETIRMRERTYHNGGVTDSNGSPLPLQEIENSASSQRFRQMDRAVQSSPLYNDENQVNLASCHKQNKHHEEVHKTRVCTTRSGIIGSNRPPLQEIENLSSSPRLRQINRVVQSSSSHRYEKPMISIRSKESDSRNDLVGSNRSPLQGLEKSYWPKYLHKNREVSSPYD